MHYLSLGVILVALGVLQSNLTAERLDPDGKAKQQGKAETCEFKIIFIWRCSNWQTTETREVCYTDKVTRDVLLNGIADLDIRCDVLSTKGIQTKPIADTIALVETRETACNANPTSAVSALSEYRQSNQDCLIQQKQQVWSCAQSQTTVFDQSKTAACPDCGSTFHRYSKKARGWNKCSHTLCKSCWKNK